MGCVWGRNNVGFCVTPNERRAVIKFRATNASPGNHFAGKIDPDDSVPGSQKSLTDQPRSAAGVEHGAF